MEMENKKRIRHDYSLGVGVEKGLLSKQIESWRPYLIMRDDVPDLMKKFGVSERSAEYYLSGRIGSLAMGRLVVEFLQPVIDNRKSLADREAVAGRCVETDKRIA
jgi:hypothetical protein